MKNVSSAGVYIIKNKINGKKYIGSSINTKNRINAHLNALRKGKGFKNLQKDFNKFGEHNFEFATIEMVFDKDELLKREDYYIDKYNTLERGYNVRRAIPRGRNDVSTVLSNDVFNEVKTECDARNMTISAWIREAVIEKLERRF